MREQSLGHDALFYGGEGTKPEPKSPKPAPAQTPDANGSNPPSDTPKSG
ncbi:MAG: hypothetical protein K2Y05_11895 [Hyphomicrobiaceae bacterium]|nr:hypothetical protein [Hyphomicrobiaceae bacterium]